MREKTTEGERDREREGESVGAHRCESVRQPHTHTHTHKHTHTPAATLTHTPLLPQELETLQASITTLTDNNAKHGVVVGERRYACFQRL